MQRAGLADSLNDGGNNCCICTYTGLQLRVGGLQQVTIAADLLSDLPSNFEVASGRLRPRSAQNPLSVKPKPLQVRRARCRACRRLTGESSCHLISDLRCFLLYPNMASINWSTSPRMYQLLYCQAACALQWASGPQAGHEPPRGQPETRHVEFINTVHTNVIGHGTPGLLLCRSRL